MHPSKSSAEVQSGQPVAAPPQPTAKPPVHAEPPPSRWGWWVAAAAVAGLAAAGYFYWKGARPASSTTVAVVRTAPVVRMPLNQTLRLSGTTQAEKFGAILVPQLRGGSFGRGGPSGSFSRRGSSGTTVSATRSTPLSSGSSSSGSQSRSASAMQAATSRVGGSRSSGGGGGSAANQAASAAMGSGLGSTANSLPGGSSGPSAVGSVGGGGGGGGGSPRGRGGDFQLTLQEVAKPGIIVKKGDVVAEFDRQNMITRLDDYRASLDQTRASFKKMEAELQVNVDAHAQSVAIAKANLDKAKLDLKTIPVASAINAERLKLAAEEAEAQYKQVLKEVPYVQTGVAADKRVAQIELQQTEIEYKRSEANIDRMIMKAPIDGMVVMQNVFRGSDFDQVKAGDLLSPGMMFMQVVDPSSMIVNATVNQTDIEKVRIGQKASVRFDAFPGLQVPAKVHAISTVAKSSRSRPDWVKEMQVVLRLEKLDPRIIPDLSAAVDIHLDSAPEGAVVPREAIHYTQAAAGQAATPFVYVRGQAGQWVRREVELGLVSNTQVSVKSGLQEKEVVALETPPSAASPKG